MKLQNRHAVVTGGGTGIGLAIAKALNAEGAIVTIMGRNKSRLDAVATAHQGMYAIALDVTDPESVNAAFKAASDIQTVNILINNAGVVKTASFEKISLDDWQMMQSVNVTGTLLCTQAALPDIKSEPQGRIINIASTSGLKGYPYTAAYSASKHAVIGLTKSLALELSKTEVTANAVCPGFCNTEIVQDAIKNIVDKTGRNEEEAIAELVTHNPQTRLIEPEEVAETVLWLCQENSRSITGQSILVAGGELM